jgi:hypothetical protein
MNHTPDATEQYEPGATHLYGVVMEEKMKLYQKILAIVLAVAILTTSVFLYFRKRNQQQEASNQSPVIKAEDLVNAVLQPSEMIKPEKPADTGEKVLEKLEPLQRLLISEEIKYSDFFSYSEIESKIFKASSLTELVQSKRELEGLVELREQLARALENGLTSEPQQQIVPRIPEGTAPEREILSRMEELMRKLDELFKPGQLSVDERLTRPMKGTWTQQDKVILRWMPADGWKPEQGYNLFRVIGGEAEQIAQGLGSSERILQLAESGLDFSSMAVSLFKDAALDAEKMQTLGIQSEREFQQRINAGQPSAQASLRFTGEVGFAQEKQRLFSGLEKTTEEKIPLADVMENQVVLFVSELNDSLSSFWNFESKPAPEPQLVTPLTPAQQTANRILSARRMISTQVFLDARFADAAGFGYEDDLSGKNIPVNTPIQYVVVPLEGDNTHVTARQIASGDVIEGSLSVVVVYGVEEPVEKPEEVDGIGADNQVSLRWKAPVSVTARSTISGYHIERKKKGDAEFVRINQTPVAISYMKDSNNIYCETDAFFIDDAVQNNGEYIYRVQALDVFGRLSEYSDLLEIKVIKVTPPQTPVLGQPEMSEKTNAFTLPVCNHVFEINRDIPGVALPISKTSEDTDMIAIYRSEVYGNGPFGAPRQVAVINLKPFIQTLEPVYSTNGHKGIFVIKPKAELSLAQQFDTVFFDSDVAPGHYYKYWAAAIDGSGNESLWSQSKVIGYPASESPENPAEPVATLHYNDAVYNRSENPPGFFDDYATNPSTEKDVSHLLDGMSQGSVLPVGGASNEEADISWMTGGNAPGSSAAIAPGLTGSNDSGSANSGNPDSTSSSAPGSAGSGNPASASSGNLGFSASNTDVRLVLSQNDTPVMGFSVSDVVRIDNGIAPTLLSLEMNNLPKARDVHRIIAFTPEDIPSGGRAVFSWDPYSGSGLAGYNIYFATAENLPQEALRNMTKDEVIGAFEWSLAAKNRMENQFSKLVNPKQEEIYLFMVCLVPKISDRLQKDEFNYFMPGGWVRLGWDRPKDPQVSYFRVYRAEVPYFKENEDYSALQWNMVADNVRYPVYSEKVEQNFAHFYYYKVTSVSAWGAESEGTVTRFRVPATTAPEAPSMLVPFSKKGRNEINWLGVPHANKYIIYRTPAPIVDQEFNTDPLFSKADLYREMFNQHYLDERFDSRVRLGDVIRQVNEQQVIGNGDASKIFASSGIIHPPAFLLSATTVQKLSELMPKASLPALGTRMKTQQAMSFNSFKSRISTISIDKKQELFKTIAEKYGALAVLPYSFLDEMAAGQIAWEVAGEVDIAPGEDSSGKKTFYDADVLYGKTYLYTVQAVNDDQLASDRPEPVSVFTRKGEPFPPVKNLRWSSKDGNHPTITWDPAQDPRLGAGSQRYLEGLWSPDGIVSMNTAGYLVYRSDKRDGDYYQASWLIADCEEFTDLNASLADDNWYKVKVVDTAGYISDFSEPLYVHADLVQENPVYELVPGSAGELENMPEQDHARLPAANSEETAYGRAFASANNVDQLASATKLQPITPSPKPRFVTPTPALQRTTPTPRLEKATPTPRLQPATPSPKPQLVTPTPSLQLTTPTPRLEKVTPTPKLQPATPSPEPQKVTPTPTQQRITPTPAAEKVTPAPAQQKVTPTPMQQKVTPTPAPYKITPTPAPQKVTPTPIPGMQFVTPAPTPAFHMPTPTPPVLQVKRLTMVLNGFTIEDIPATALTEGFGEGKLKLDQFMVPVNVQINAYDGSTITDGAASLVNEVTLGNTGIQFSSLELQTNGPKDAIIAGTVQKPSGYLAGDLKKISFGHSRLASNGVIHITQNRVFHYQNLKFINTGKITINFGNLDDNSPFANFAGSLEDIYGPGFVNLHRGKAENNLGFETVDNHGLVYDYDTVSFGFDGKLTGFFTLTESDNMKLVIPAGLCIQATNSAFVYKNGLVDASQSHIEGSILTPFETWTENDGNSSQAAESDLHHFVTSEMIEQLAQGSLKNSPEDSELLDISLYYMSQLVLANAYLVYPDDLAYGSARSAAPFSVKNWDGMGFMVNDTTMTPSSILLCDPEKANQPGQREAKMGLIPDKVAVDLRRDTVYQGDAPEDTKIPEWMGIVAMNGEVALPPAYVQNKQGKPVSFTLTPGQLLYDQNGFCYQNQVFTPEGAPAQFGRELGNFSDVLVRNVVMDLYNNIADVEIEADVYVELFKRRLNVKMLKDLSGRFVCNVNESEQFDPAGDGKVKLRVAGGRVNSEGMRIYGAMDLSFGNKGEELKLSDASFHGLLIPSEPLYMHENVGSKYGTALFGKPYRLMYHDFPMELRGFKLTNVYGEIEADGFTYDGVWLSTTLNLWGGMQLSDNMTMNANRDLDTIAIHEVFSKPDISKEDSHSEVVLVFEDFAELHTTGRPIEKKAGYIEYDTGDFSDSETTSNSDITKNAEFGFSASNSLDITIPGFAFNTRVGYDKTRQRSYFAIAMYYTEQGIPFCCGEMHNFGGLIGYNMDAPKEDGVYQIPDDELILLKMVDNFSVNEGSGNYFFAATCSIKLGYDAFTIGELSNCYFCVEKGPDLEMGAFFKGPDSIDDFSGGGKGLVTMGRASVGYYHSKQLFKFSLSIDDFGMYGVNLSGDFGFETCPDYWDLRIGHPNRLAMKVLSFYGGIGLWIRNRNGFAVDAGLNIGFATEASIEVVKVRGFLEAGADGHYSSDMFALSAYVRGGITGSALGYDVISLMLEARGRLAKTRESQWKLSAGASISYHIDLAIDISGSVDWDVTLSF